MKKNLIITLFIIQLLIIIILKVIMLVIILRIVLKLCKVLNQQLIKNSHHNPKNPCLNFKVTKDHNPIILIIII